MSEVGALIIKLQAETAQFREDMGKVKGDLAGLSGQSQETGSAMGSSMMEAKGSMMLLGEEVGVRIPRHLQTLIAKIPGVSNAFAAILPAVGILAAIALMTKVIAKMDEARDKVSNFGSSWAEATSTTVSKTGTLYAEILKLRDETAKLYGKPAMNGPAIAAIEALDKINSLDSGILKTIIDMEKLMKEENIGVIDSLFTGKEGTGDIEAILKPKMDAIKNAMMDVTNAESKLETDMIAGNKAALAGDQAAINSKKAIAAAAIAAANDSTVKLMAGQDAMAKQQIDLVGEVGTKQHEEVTQLTAEQSAAVKEQQSAARQMIASTQLQTASMQQQLSMGTALTQATRDRAAAQGVSDEGKKRDELLKTSQVIMKAFNDTQKLGQEYDRLQQHIVEVNFKLLAEDAERAGQAEDKMLKSGEAIAKSFQDIARARDAVSADDQMAALEEQIEGYKRLAQAGLLSESQLAQDLKPIYEQETDAKLAVVQEELDRQKSIEVSARAAGETVVANQAVAKEVELQHKLAQIRQEGVKQQNTLDQQMNANWQNMCKQFESGFANSVSKTIVEGKSFGQSMRQVGVQFLEEMITNNIKWLISTVTTNQARVASTAASGEEATSISLAQDLKARFSAAKTAAAKAMTTVGFPLDLVVAPLVFAAALAFAEGGIVPGMGSGDTVPAMLTPGEAVLPQPMVEKLSASTASTTGGDHYHMHYSPTNHIKAWDGSDVKDAMDQHRNEFIKQAQKEMRRRHK